MSEFLYHKGNSFENGGKGGSDSLFFELHDERSDNISAILTKTIRKYIPKHLHKHKLLHLEFTEMLQRFYRDGGNRDIRSCNRS